MSINQKQKNAVKYDKAILGFYSYVKSTQEEAEKYKEMYDGGKLLPENIIWEDTGRGSSYFEFFEILDYNNNDSFYTEYLLTKIKNWVTFFGVITVLGIITGVILAVYFGLK